MSRWLRREAAALVLAGLLGAGTVGWTLHLDGRPYRDSLPGESAVAAGAPAVLEGTAFTVTGTRSVVGGSRAGERLDVAEDATLVVVTLQVVPDADDPLGICGLALVDGGAEGTRWDAASFTETSWSAPDRFATYCDDEETAPYELQEAFVVPTEVAGRVDLEVTRPPAAVPAVRLDLAGAPAR
ncbi:hypothetical protein G5V58_05805 [Nocardioides anomalus]|uniref:DUF4352 domain-containing protein n=1 Tax=Nocardioides anomalus TaxID=2712223 RepID=A0A6G6WB13_9ACTN|nr:hypothetical protein [Nocardioides anomalus]QIG42347.1 hypothetical protein G5V58_05805 [Nocardioides anomalus]